MYQINCLNCISKLKVISGRSSCSLFPDEMECFFGDAILYKVEKDCLEEDEKIAHFKVISMCNEVDVVNKFIDEYLSIDENFELAHSTHEDYNGRSITLHWLFSMFNQSNKLNFGANIPLLTWIFSVALFLSIGGSGPFITPLKPMSQVVEVNSDNDIEDVDIIEDSQPLSFLKDIIVTPPGNAKSPTKEDNVLSTVKRNLVEQFDGVSKVEGKKSLRRVRVKVEKE
ncbi:hypothetical protein P8452_68612 [Trifolium repens]|nr:hypothetical protein P8452_68612 [Trifolium repens]